MTNKQKQIVLLPGDGIGPEIMRVAVRVLQDCATEFGHKFEYSEFPFGGCAIDQTGEPLPDETLATCRAADAILLGAIGGPKWDGVPLARRPETGLLALRKALGLYINLRPIDLHTPLRGLSPLRADRVSDVHIDFVRELAGDVYFGEHRLEADPSGERATDSGGYTTKEIERVAKYAFARAEARKSKVASVDKSNVLAMSQLWRKTVTRMAADHPGVKLEHLYVDNAAMQLVLAPAQFDVILTSNMFGDILSDLGAALAGSIGLIPSMSLGPGPSLYEPIHGSAPTLAGKDLANPVGMILSTTMMLRESFGLTQESEWIESAVDRLFAKGIRTPDTVEPGTTKVGCKEFGERLHVEMLDALKSRKHHGRGI
ncbi:MAG TPA: 3-isopropylmalate dehydrogenase [Candidatus Acidoferrales bacterium]|nr:3-isopropylmalate dehydrogenase [Candidatus Acidoferrales bacterium]